MRGKVGKKKYNGNRQYKAWLSVLLAAGILTTALSGCGTGAETEEKSQKQPTAESVTAAAETTEGTAASVYEGELYLNVSAIDLSLVGDSEDLYAGSLPREVISWESDDPSVCSFENGVLTAVGRGHTTVRGAYLEQQVEIPVSCLAETPEELNSLDMSVLQKPKRLPPPVHEGEVTCLNEAAIIGDSISYILFQNEMRTNALGDVLFLARGGVSINSLVRHYKDLYYKGMDRAIEDIVADTGVRQIFIMLGQNDLGFMDADSTFANLKLMVDRIREKSPDVEVYLESCLPEYRPEEDCWEKNTLMDSYNEMLKDYVRENGFHYVDVAKYVENHRNNMAHVYHMDERHLNPAGCDCWMQVLKAHMHMEELQQHSCAD